MVDKTTKRAVGGESRTAGGRLLRVLGGGALLLAFSLITAEAASAGPCQKSARLAKTACKFDAKDDFFESKAICAHVSNDGDREDCLADAADARDENLEHCADVLDFRLDFCARSGEGFYDPPFTKSMFTDTFDDSNPFWILTPGSHWEFEGDGETVVVEVLDATKRIGNKRGGKPNCIVVNDVVADEDGLLIEDTDDWYALGTNGDVYYCGEQSKDYEYFRGDNPQEAELVHIDGSFKHGVDGSKAGVAMFANPTVGDIYRQEFSLGNAEDGAEVMSTTYRYGDGSGLDRNVPQALADLFCSGDCLVTREFNLNEPGAEALKYYSPGVGVFLEVEGRSVVQLVACNVDPRCNDL